MTVFAMHQRLLSLQLDELEEPAWATQGLVDRSGVPPPRC